MQEKVYIDTSSLIILNKINALHLLQRIYGKVIITTQIKFELNESIRSWIVVETTNEIEQSFLKRYKLGAGESRIITNALKNNSILIIDNLKARKVTTLLRLRYTGSIGVLIIAKELGIIHSLKFYLEKIQATNFRVSDALIKTALQLANEK